MTVMSTDLIHILVVDDFELVRKINVKNLEKMGFKQVECCAGGKEALAAINCKTYHLVLLDMYMPDMDGRETLIELRKQGFKMPVVMCTDESDDKVLNEIKRLGAQETIKKPYSPDHFKSVIMKVLNL